MCWFLAYLRDKEDWMMPLAYANCNFIAILDLCRRKARYVLVTREGRIHQSAAVMSFFMSW